MRICDGRHIAGAAGKIVYNAPNREAHENACTNKSREQG